MQITPSLIVPVPLLLMRSALFAVARPKAGTYYTREQVPIAPQRKAALARTGVPLHQLHALAWQAVLHFAVEEGITDDSPFTVAADDLLRVMGGRGGDSSQRRRLRGWLDELAHVAIDYETQSHRYRGPLLMPLVREIKVSKKKSEAETNMPHRLVLRLPPGLPTLLSHEVLRNDLGRKVSMGTSALSLWLHDYLGTHLRPPLDAVEGLRVWSGSSQSLVRFRHELRKALRRLEAQGAGAAESAAGRSGQTPGPLVLHWNIDRRDRLHIEKAATRVYIRSSGDSHAKRQRKTAAADHARLLRANGTQ